MDTSCFGAGTAPETDTEFERQRIEGYNCQELTNISVAFARLSFYHLPFLQVNQAAEIVTASKSRLIKPDHH